MSEPTETKREFKGVWIRASLWNRDDLTWFQKCLLAEIDNLAHGCFASNGWLAKRMLVPERTLTNNLTVLRKKHLIIDWGFDGRRRQISVADCVSSDPKNSIPANGYAALPNTGTIDTSVDFQKSKESKETSFSKTRDISESESASPQPEYPATWKPIAGTKSEQLKRIRPPKVYPSEREFDEFVSESQLDQIGMGKRTNLYGDLCDQKWHHWNGRRWNRINDWRKYVARLDVKMQNATGC